MSRSLRGVPPERAKSLDEKLKVLYAVDPAVEAKVDIGLRQSVNTNKRILKERLKMWKSNKNNYDLAEKSRSGTCELFSFVNLRCAKFAVKHALHGMASFSIFCHTAKFKLKLCKPLWGMAGLGMYTSYVSFQRVSFYRKITKCPTAKKKKNEISIIEQHLGFFGFPKTFWHRKGGYKEISSFLKLGFPFCRIIFKVCLILSQWDFDFGNRSLNVLEPLCLSTSTRSDTVGKLSELEISLNSNAIKWTTNNSDQEGHVTMWHYRPPVVK